MHHARSQSAVLDHSINDVPMSVLDTETTGLYPGADRLVELSIVRVPPGGEPEVLLDTLINPQRAVAATEIHGISDADVADAPTFSDIAGDVAKAIAETVVGAYNVYFDVRFVREEFARIGFRHVPPHICLMYLRPLLGLGKKCSLSDACRAHGIQHEECHTAVSDARASARLWALYRRTMAERGVQTFRDLTGLKTYKFMDSLAQPPLGQEAAAALPSCGRCKPRARAATSRTNQLHEYCDALAAVVADLELSEAEIAYLDAKRGELKLTIEELRAVHGRVFAAVLGDALGDSWVSDDEWLRLRRLHECLRQLGWAPGM